MFHRRPYTPHRALPSLFRLPLCVAIIWLLGGCGAVAAPPSPGERAAPSSPTTPSAIGQAFPLTLTDDTGRLVVIRQEPKRIVSVAPSNTELLFALGLGDQVVGVTTFCDYPEAARAKPKIGGLRPSLEAIVAQQPDLVLGIRGTPPEVVAALEGQQIPVALLNPPDFAGVLTNVQAVGRMTGASTAAAQLVDTMQQRWDAVAVRARLATARPRVLYEIDGTDAAAVSVAGPGTFISAMITAAGGTNVLDALTPGQQYPKISAEAVLQANPDLIILGDAPYGQSRETLAQRPGWSALEAVQRGAVVGIADPNLTSRPGPRLVDGLELVARAVHPELFDARSTATGTGAGAR